jgi:hypothetical protein
MAARVTLLETPEGRVQPGRSGTAAVRPAPLDEAADGQIDRQWRLGVSVDELAERFGRSRPGIERVINAVRARRILEQRHGYVYDPSFDTPGAAATILAAMPAATRGAGSSPPPLRRVAR